jgi:hypothetical protein
MDNLANKIKAYLGRTPDFREEVILQNDDGTDYIKEWNATDKPKPTDEQLDAVSSQAETLKNNAIAVANRKTEYGTPQKMVWKHGNQKFKK